ncbi:MAG: DNA polymerase IV [Ruminococcaceae bacterium]|nr:DNA polymerase IV [Oscillospiraceae bacterium]
MDRVILHCDLNCFYASVELLSRPELQNVPTAVCGDPLSRHGIILAKNEPAKRCGVQTAETIWQARKKCPGLVLLPPHHDLYHQYSKKVNEIYGQYTDLVEPFGIDESWLDVTGSLHLFGGDGEQLAHQLRQRIRQELGLTISVGVSFNKIFAKLGSDYKKPDAVTVIGQNNWQEIVWPLPVESLLFVGRSTRQTLTQFGIRTIGQLAACQPNMLEELLGKQGLQLYEYATGQEHSPVRAQHDPEPVKSVGNGTTFRQDLTHWEEIRSGLALLADSVAMRLRHHGLYCSGVAVTIKDSQFHSFTRQKQLPSPTRLMKDILQAAAELTQGAWKAPTPVRALTVTALYITQNAESFQQLDLLSGGHQQADERQEKLESTMSLLRDKYGKSVISFGDTNGRKLPHDPQ